MKRLLALSLLLAGGIVGSASAAGSPPSNTGLPGISGTARDGSMLTASKGSWTGSPTSYAYQWERCDTLGGSCGSIAGANSFRYTVGSADVGHTLRVVVTATNADGNGSATSRPTGTVSASGHAPGGHAAAQPLGDDAAELDADGRPRRLDGCAADQFRLLVAALRRDGEQLLDVHRALAREGVHADGGGRRSRAAPRGDGDELARVDVGVQQSDRGRHRGRRRPRRRSRSRACLCRISS